MPGDQKLEQTINRSSIYSDGIFGHYKQKEFIAEWDLIYHEMLGVNNFYREYTGIDENTSESYKHHQSSKSYTKKNECEIQAITRYIEDKGSPYNIDGPTTLQNLVTKQVMNDDIRNDLLRATEKGNI